MSRRVDQCFETAERAPVSNAQEGRARLEEGQPSAFLLLSYFIADFNRGIFYTGTCASEFNNFLDVDVCDDLREEDQSRCAFGLGLCRVTIFLLVPNISTRRRRMQVMPAKCFLSGSVQMPLDGNEFLSIKSQGGYRMWPWPGYWTSGERSGVTKMNRIVAWDSNFAVVARWWSNVLHPHWSDVWVGMLTAENMSAAKVSTATFAVNVRMATTNSLENV